MSHASHDPPEESELGFRRLPPVNAAGAARSWWFPSLALVMVTAAFVLGTAGRGRALFSPGEVPSAAPEKQPLQGTLLVTSDPSGADVYCDGQLLGTTPLCLAGVPGRHTLRLERRGYEPERFCFALPAGGQAAEMPLRKLRPSPTGTLVVDALPWFAQAVIADSEVPLKKMKRDQEGAWWGEVEWEGKWRRGKVVLRPEGDLFGHEFVLEPEAGQGKKVALLLRFAEVHAEVLLDGISLGHTPLVRAGIPYGRYQVTVRRTNFSTFETKITIARRDPPVVLSNLELRDLVQENLQNFWRTEPQRIAHFVDACRYYWVLNRAEAAAAAFSRAEELRLIPLSFPEETSKAEMELEQELRAQDIGRMQSERKHMLQPDLWVEKKDFARLSQLLESAQARISRRQYAHWEWTGPEVDRLLEARRFDEALRLLNDHLAVKKENAAAWAAMMKVQLALKNPAEARRALKYALQYAPRDVTMLQGMAAWAIHHGRRPSSAGRDEILELADTALAAARNSAPNDEFRAQITHQQSQLARLKNDAEKHLALLKNAIALAPEPSLREGWSYELALAYFHAARYAESRQTMRETLEAGFQNTYWERATKSLLERCERQLGSKRK